MYISPSCDLSFLLLKLINCWHKQISPMCEWIPVSFNQHVIYKKMYAQSWTYQRIKRLSSHHFYRTLQLIWNLNSVLLLLTINNKHSIQNSLIFKIYLALWVCVCDKSCDFLQFLFHPTLAFSKFFHLYPFSALLIRVC